MGVLVAFAVTETLRAFVVRVAEVARDGDGAAFFHVLGRIPDRHRAGVALGGAGDVDRRLGERQLALGQTDEDGRLHGGVRQHEGHRVGVAHVLGGADGDPPGDEARVFAGFEHPGEPVDGRVGIAAAHRLDQGAGGVVMLVAGAVVDDRFALDGVLGGFKRDRDLGFPGLGITLDL